MWTCLHFKQKAHYFVALSGINCAYSVNYCTRSIKLKIAFCVFIDVDLFLFKECCWLKTSRWVYSKIAVLVDICALQARNLTRMSGVP